MLHVNMHRQIHPVAAVMKQLTSTDNCEVPPEPGGHVHNTSPIHRTGLRLEVQGEWSSLLT